MRWPLDCLFIGLMRCQQFWLRRVQENGTVSPQDTGPPNSLTDSSYRQADLKLYNEFHVFLTFLGTNWRMGKDRRTQPIVFLTRRLSNR